MFSGIDVEGSTGFLQDLKNNVEALRIDIVGLKEAKTTKKTKKDFQTYLNGDDISSLGMLFEEMIRKEVFDEEYLKKLDDYFIKEKLEDIINIGKQILSLKVESVKTQEAIKLIKKYSKKI